MILNLLENQNNIEPFTNKPINLLIDSAKNKCSFLSTRTRTLRKNAIVKTTLITQHGIKNCVRSSYFITESYRSSKTNTISAAIFYITSISNNKRTLISPQKPKTPKT